MLYTVADYKSHAEQEHNKITPYISFRVPILICRASNTEMSNKHFGMNNRINIYLLRK